MSETVECNNFYIFIFQKNLVNIHFMDNFSLLIVIVNHKKKKKMMNINFYSQENLKY